MVPAGTSGSGSELLATEIMATKTRVKPHPCGLGGESRVVFGASLAMLYVLLERYSIL